jgi:hypothetical protein
MGKTIALSRVMLTRWSSETNCVSSVATSRPALKATILDASWDKRKSGALDIEEIVEDDSHFSMSRTLVSFSEASRYACVMLQGMLSGLADVYNQILRMDLSVRNADISIIGRAVQEDLLEKWLRRVEFMYHPAMLVAWTIHPKFATVSASVSSVVVLRWIKKIMQPIDERSFENVKRGFLEYRNMTRRREDGIWSATDVADGPTWHLNYTGHLHGGIFSEFAAALLSLAASAAAGEGNWSVQGLVVSERRTNLRDDRATKLVGVKWNLKAMEHRAAMDRRAAPPKMHRAMTYEQLQACSQAVEPASEWKHPEFGANCFVVRKSDAAGFGFKEEEIDAAINDDDEYEGENEDDDEEDEDESDEEEEEDEGEGEDRYTIFEPAEGYYVANVPRRVREVEVGDLVAYFFTAPYFAWFTGEVMKVGKVNRNHPEDNVMVEFEDGLAFLPLTTETYGADESWVLVRETMDDDDEEESDEEEDRSHQYISPTKDGKRRRRRQVEEEEDEPPGRINL